MLFSRHLMMRSARTSMRLGSHHALVRAWIPLAAGEDPAIPLSMILARRRDVWSMVMGS